MPLYRVIRSSRRSALPSSSWMCKPTDEAAVAAARELLKRGDYAEVWGEDALVACLGNEGRSAAAPARTAASMPMMRYVAAGFATTAGIALIFAAMQARSVPAADHDGQPTAGWAMLDPVAAGTPSPDGDPTHAPAGSTLSDTADAAAMPTAVAANTPSAGDPESVAVTGAEAADMEATLAVVASEPPEAPAVETPAATKHAARYARYHPAPRHWPATQGQVFASGERSTVDVYGMFARGYVQGGN